ncbi:outer membrane beta-barrel protein [soil metagenome]
MHDSNNVCMCTKSGLNMLESRPLLGGPMSISKISKTISYLALAGSALISEAAIAQNLQAQTPVLPYDYSTDRTTVANRQRPDYITPGIAVGNLTVRPMVEGGVGYSDNVFGNETGGTSDWYAGFNPSILVEGSGGESSRRNFQLSLDANLRRYAQEKVANQTAFGARANITQPLGGPDNYITIGGYANRSYERQESSGFPNAPVAPIKYDDFNGFARVRVGGSRVRATVGVDATHNKFSDARLADGSVFDQGYRDRTIIRGSGRVETSFTGAVSAFVEGRYSNINYLRDMQTPTLANRDGNQAEALAGMMIDAGKLRGSIAGGYTRRTFDSSTYKDFGGFALNGEMVYFASGLSTVTLSGYRNITESGDPLISAQFGTGVAAKIDHELLRYIILKGSVSYDRYTFRNSSRNDNVAMVTGGVRYLANRHLEVNADASYVKRSSSGGGFGPEFDRLEFAVNLVGRF